MNLDAVAFDAFGTICDIASRAAKICLFSPVRGRGAQNHLEPTQKKPE